MLEINVFFFVKNTSQSVKADITSDHGPGAAEGTTALSSLLMNLKFLILSLIFLKDFAFSCIRISLKLTDSIDPVL